MAASLSEIRGSWGQKGTSGENSATDVIADATEIWGRLPIPVTAPAGTKGFRLMWVGTAIDGNLSILRKSLPAGY
jgi:hypothetical protein